MVVDIVNIINGFAQHDMLCTHVVYSSESAMQSHIRHIDSVLTDVKEFGVGFSDVVSVISIPIIVGILTIAIPLLAKTFIQIDDKYKARELGQCFLYEPICILLYIFSFSAIVLIIAYVLNRAEWLSYVLFANSLVLVSILFLLIWTIILYNDPYKLYNHNLPRLKWIKKYLEKNDLSVEAHQDGLYDKILYSCYDGYNKILAGLLIYSIRIGDENLLCFLAKEWQKYIQLIRTEQTKPAGTRTEIVYQGDIYDLLIQVVISYKEQHDNEYINRILAIILTEYLRCDKNEEIGVENCYAIFPALFEIGKNKHFVLINESQRYIREIFSHFVANQKHSANYVKDLIRITNSVLFKNGLQECVDDAIANNADAFIPTSLILPTIDVDVLSDYLCIISKPAEYLKPYVGVINGGDAFNFTALYRSIADYYAYLFINVALRTKQGNADAWYVPSMSNGDIENEIKRLRKALEEALSKRTDKDVIMERFGQCVLSVLTKRYQDACNCSIDEAKVSDDFVNNQQTFLLQHLEGITENASPYRSVDRTIDVEPFEIEVERHTLSNEHIENANSSFLWSRIYEHCMDTLSNVYKKYTISNEIVISSRQFKDCIVDQICETDYTLLVNFPSNMKFLNQMVFREFDAWMPQHSCLVIPYEFVPVLNYQVPSFEVIDEVTNKIAGLYDLPKVKLRIIPNISFGYSSSAQMKVIRIK